MLDTVLREIRQAGRSLFRTPVVTLAVVATLALGIGANTAIYSAVRALLLDPLPYREPGGLVMIWSKWTGFNKTWLSDAEVLDYRTLRAFESVAAWGTRSGNLTGDGEPVRVGFEAVTANVFSTLGVTPILGRTFTEAEDHPGQSGVTVLSYGLWQRRYGGDPQVVGRTIQLNGVDRTVLGVMPKDFQLPTDFNVNAAEPSQLWVPLGLDPANLTRGSHGYYGAARLSPGTTVEQANAEVSSLVRGLTENGLYPPAMQFSPFVVSVESEILGGVRPAVLLLWGAVGFLLLIACANVSNLLLARSESRQRELAVCAAIGASPARLARGLLVEGLLLGSAGTLGGCLIAVSMLPLLSYADPKAIPRLSAVTIGMPVFAFAAVLAIVVTIVFSFAPIWRATRLDLTDSIKEGSTQTTGGVRRQRLRSALAIAQIALSVILLIGAGLALRSLWALEAIPLGFEPENVLTMRVTVPAAAYREPAAVIAFHDALLSRVRSLPGVRHAGLLRSLPLADEIGDWGLMVEGFVAGPGHQPKGDWQVASGGAAEALGERLVRGRLLQDTDVTDSTQVAVINEAMAQAYWPGSDPIGRRFRMGRNPDRPWVTVVGIVGDVRHNGIRGGVKEKFYRPHTQFHVSAGNAARSMTLVVKADRSPLSLSGPIREQVRALDPNLPVANVRLMGEVVNDSIATSRFSGLLLAVFAGIALTLAALGVYSVLAYVVNQNAREFGVRIAMGAGRGRILTMVASRGLRYGAAGAVIGLLGALALVRSMSALLYEVRPADPATFAAVTVLMTMVCLGASLVPAIRATRLDPLRVLKGD